MATDQLASALRSLPAAWHAHYFDAVDSTQDEARAAALNGAPDRSLFVADFQRAGRGRQGRTWQAGAGSALLLSVLFRGSVQVSVEVAPLRYTMLASVSLCEAIEAELRPCQASIKWPNDVMLADRKVAGILAETSRDLAIVGVGVNAGAAPAGVANATSLSAASDRPVDRGQLLLAFVGRMDRWLAAPQSELRAVWESRLWGRGQTLRLVDLGQTDEVVVLGAAADGSLRVRLPDGSERLTATGELLG